MSDNNTSHTAAQATRARLADVLADHRVPPSKAALLITDRAAFVDALGTLVDELIAEAVRDALIDHCPD